MKRVSVKPHGPSERVRKLAKRVERYLNSPQVQAACAEAMGRDLANALRYGTDKTRWPN